MKKSLFNKIKKLLYIIFSYLKNLLISLFSFFFNLFSDNKKTKTKKNNEEQEKNIKSPQIKQNDIASYHDESSRIIDNSNDTTFKYNEDTIKELIKFFFLQELELEEKDLDKKVIAYLEELNNTIIIKVTKYPIPNQDSLAKSVHDILLDELEEQLKLEQNNKTIEIVTPLIFNREPETLKSNHDTFLKKTLTKKKNLSYEDINNLPRQEEKTNNTPLSPLLDDETNQVIKDSITPSNTRTNKIESPNPFEATSKEETNINQPPPESNSNSQIESLVDEPPLPAYITPVTLTTNQLEKPKEAQKENPFNEEEKKSTPPKPDFENYNFIQLDDTIKSVINNSSQELNKEELDDKDYETLEKQIASLLNEINKLKAKNLSPEALKELNNREKQLIKLKDNIELQKQEDINNETNLLEETISLEELQALEKELEKFHIEDKLYLQENYLKKLEELNSLSPKKAKDLEKELLKAKLRKTLNIMNISIFPFARNKYFHYYINSLMTNRSLKMFHAILRRETLEYEPPTIDHIRKGINALDEALVLSNQNIAYLNYLEIEALKKHPELVLDAKYMSYIKKIKIKLLKKQEKMLKKEKTLNKYNLKKQRRIRKLKKDETSSYKN